MKLERSLLPVGPTCEAHHFMLKMHDATSSVAISTRTEVSVVLDEPVARLPNLATFQAAGAPQGRRRLCYAVHQMVSDMPSWNVSSLPLKYAVAMLRRNSVTFKAGSVETACRSTETSSNRAKIRSVEDAAALSEFNNILAPAFIEADGGSMRTLRAYP
jgi:hypothetical protein